VISNHAFLGVVVPQGEGIIEIIYDDSIKRINIYIMLGGIALLAFLVIILRNLYKRYE